MNALYLIRHSLTAANEQRLYGGSTDSPLSPSGRQLALEVRARRPLPRVELCVTSGMARATETLRLLSNRAPDLILPGLREMDFGVFEMRSYDELRHVPDFIRWIEDDTGEVHCPGGECLKGFRDRVLSAGAKLLIRPEASGIAVCHGGAIVTLMQAWFPHLPRDFYQWQPAACRGYRISVERGTPKSFDDV